MSNDKCHNVVCLDVRGLSPVTDYMIVASGTSPRQMQSALENVEEAADTFNQIVLSRAGAGSDNWMVVDFFNVVVHVFSDEAREYYDLDTLWGDAPTVEWRKD